MNKLCIAARTNLINESHCLQFGVSGILRRAGGNHSTIRRRPACGDKFVDDVDAAFIRLAELGISSTAANFVGVIQSKERVCALCG